MDHKVRIGLYGSNGHQIQQKLKDHPNAKLVAVCKLSQAALEEIGKEQMEAVKIYDTLEQMLADEKIDLISLCSPKRKDQAADAIACLNAGKHVYAEKPGALSVVELEEILSTAKENDREFHEMTNTIYCEPYWSMRKLIQAGKIGKVVQVYVQKSYRLRLVARPQDEVTDGGLIRWVGIHAIRFLEHITGVRVKDVKVYQTHLGNSNESEGLFTASSWAMTLENGGVASACVNYLNPKAFSKPGNEAIRVFGTEGMIEITDGSLFSHVYTHESNEGEIDILKSDCRDYFDLYIEHLRYGNPMPMSLEEELHPLRVVIRAFEGAVCTVDSYHNCEG